MAGTNIDAGAMEKVTVSAGDAVSVFARKGGMKLYANQGKVEVEAQNERMRLTSRHGMKISSTEDVVEIEAEKELVLKCGKAYIRLSGGGVEVGGPKNILLKSAKYRRCRNGIAWLRCL
jgi:type VI secretion system secreted protein VgrG